MRWLVLVVVIVVLYSPTLHAQEQPGRYQIVQGNIVFLLDTVSGKTWRFSEPLGWYPTAFKEAEDAAVSPEGGASAVERWEKDAESRKLELLQSSDGEGG